MRYWIHFNKFHLIDSSGFTDAPADAIWETDTTKYTILDCYLQGTEFQKKVWKAIAEIPIGKTKTYGELVAVCGGAPISIGSACRVNKIPVCIPCHRVVGKTNKLAFNGGPDIKRSLLREEGIEI